MFEKFTTAARRTVVVAQEQARAMHQANIGTEHILLAMVAEGDTPAANVLAGNGLTDINVLHATVAGIAGVGDVDTDGHIPFTPRAKKVLELSLRESLALGHETITTEHILLGMVTDGEGVGVAVMVALGADLDKVREDTLAALTATPPRPRPAREAAAPPRNIFGIPVGDAENESQLDQFGTNLTDLAREGKLPPVIGREVEVHRMLQILARKTKNNPVLIGEAGVGKTAVVEGLAQRIIAGDVPSAIKDHHLYTLDLASMVAGTCYRGDFEQRMKAVLAEVRDRGNVILFMDEIHTMVGAGSASGTMDAANILKPVLARGEFRTIGATTLEEYTKYFEKDAALARRFKPVIIDEPTIAQTVEILAGLAPSYGAYHGVTYTDDALLAAATMSDRYITDRFLPDKAIDLLDEAGAAFSMDRPDAPEGVEVPLDVVDQDRVAAVLAAATGIQVTRLTEGETARLRVMEAELHKRVIGQDAAVKAISRSVRRTRAGLKDPNRPGGSFIFAGPSGVGKTELCKTLAEFLFNDEDALITLDMSEYAEKHTVAKLFGAPPGYIGYDEGGQLTEKVRRKPFSVVLFDEIEKAHPDIFNALLQLLDEGRVTDGQGRIVDFKNTIVVMTTNLGSRSIAAPTKLGFGSHSDVSAFETMSADVQKELKEFFRPEFLNRVDDTVVFSQLSREDIAQIVTLLVNGLNTRLADQSITVELTGAAVDKLASVGYDPVLGARPLRRAMSRHIEDALSEQILFGMVASGQTVIVDVAPATDADLFTFTATTAANMDQLTQVTAK